VISVGTNKPCITLPVASTARLFTAVPAGIVSIVTVLNLPFADAVKLLNVAMLVVDKVLNLAIPDALILLNDAMLVVDKVLNVAIPDAVKVLNVAIPDAVMLLACTSPDAFRVVTDRVFTPDSDLLFRSTLEVARL